MIPSLPDDYLLLLKFALNIAPVLQVVFVILLAIGGVATVVYSLVRTVFIIQQEQEEAAIVNDRRDSMTDLRTPLGFLRDGQYTSIRILPAIKKITSRTDLFM